MIVYCLPLRVGEGSRRESFQIMDFLFPMIQLFVSQAVLLGKPSYSWLFQSHSAGFPDQRLGAFQGGFVRGSSSAAILYSFTAS
jgi:hypothetical protein